MAWTDHARAKAQLLGIPGSDVADAILENHGSRVRNVRVADWLIHAGRWLIAYNHPAGDEQTASVVTLWRRD